MAPSALLGAPRCASVSAVRAALQAAPCKAVSGLASASRDALSAIRRQDVVTVYHIVGTLDDLLLISAAFEALRQRSRTSCMVVIASEAQLSCGGWSSVSRHVRKVAGVSGMGVERGVEVFVAGAASLILMKGVPEFPRDIVPPPQAYRRETVDTVALLDRCMAQAYRRAATSRFVLYNTCSYDLLAHMPASFWTNCRGMVVLKGIVGLWQESGHTNFASSYWLAFDRGAHDTMLQRINDRLPIVYLGPNYSLSEQTTALVDSDAFRSCFPAVLLEEHYTGLLHQTLDALFTKIIQVRAAASTTVRNGRQCVDLARYQTLRQHGESYGLPFDCGIDALLGLLPECTDGLSSKDLTAARIVFNRANTPNIDYPLSIQFSGNSNQFLLIDRTGIGAIDRAFKNRFDSFVKDVMLRIGVYPYKPPPIARPVAQTWRDFVTATDGVMTEIENAECRETRRRGKMHEMRNKAKHGLFTTACRRVV
ncbi:hypothetical protein H2203_006505 [Taxawa tesnikishii (nom. ined.)]|nr:hypothetical protein H2203_006505 [Dothideales sp. JES 119]